MLLLPLQYQEASCCHFVLCFPRLPRALQGILKTKHEQLITDMYCVDRGSPWLQVMLANHQRFPGVVALTCCWQLHAKPRLQLVTQQTPAHVNPLHLSCPRYGLHVAHFLAVCFTPTAQTEDALRLASFETSYCFCSWLVQCCWRACKQSKCAPQRFSG